MDLQHIFSLISGIAFFLFGMSSMSTGLKKLAGNKMETYIWKLSSTPLKGFLLGTATAAVIQSSGATTVMVVSFVNAGMMALGQAICIVMGANIGTTMTGWILTLSASSGTGIVGQLLNTATIVTVCAVIGILLYMFSKKNGLKHFGLIALGLSLLLLAMTMISDSVGPLKGNESFQKLLISFSNPVLGILAGILVAGILQSSSAGVGILQALCVTGSLSYSVCLPIILGINIGGSVPVLFSMVGSDKNSRRVALSYPVMNIIGLIAVYAVYLPASLVIDLSFMDSPAGIMGIAIMNTVLKIVIFTALLPMHGLIEKLIVRIVPDGDEEMRQEKELEGLRDSLADYTPSAIEQADRAVRRMAELAYDNVLRATEMFAGYSDEAFKSVGSVEDTVDKYEDKIGNFVVKISKNPLNGVQQSKIAQMLSAINDLERLSDHALNLAEISKEMSEKNISFSESAVNELSFLFSAIEEIIGMTRQSFFENKPEIAMKVEPLEETVDRLTRILRVRHIDRVQSSNCTFAIGFVFNDLLSNLERVSDHCSNIAFSVLRLTDPDREVHQYAENIAGSEAFGSSLESYSEKYIVPVEKM